MHKLAAFVIWEPRKLNEAEIPRLLVFRLQIIGDLPSIDWLIYSGRSIRRTVQMIIQMKSLSAHARD